MNLSNFLLMSILLRIAYGFTVKGPSGLLVVPLGASVLLPCSVDSLSSLEDLEVKWKRSDSQTLIHLYQDGDIRPEVQHEDYHDRAHFFTDDIKHGNFSLLLKNVTAEDEGKYTCTVHSGQESGETVVEIKDVERLIVSGSNKSLSVYVGEDVTLNCSVDSHIPAEEVSWKKRVNDEHILVLLYQNKETQPEASDVQYRDRVEFFRDEIHRGNFSLRLKRVRTEDKGEYMCQVFAGRFSDNTTVTLGQLGFLFLHIMVLILCISACGSALLFCSLIYCRSKHKGFTVKGPSGPLVVPLGGSVLLPCSVDSLLSLKDLEVQWKRSDSQTLIHLYQDGDIRPEVQNEDYHDRAHFFTDDIKYGNFSLLLKNVTAEDEGQYTCRVHSGQESGETVMEIKDVERLIVSGSDQSLSVNVGEDVTLNRSVDSHIPPEDIEEVSWKKTDKDEHILVLLYQNNKIHPDSSDEQYRHRVEFFDDEIHRGNFSLRLKRVRTEDKGEYMCQVFAGPLSSNTTVILKQLDVRVDYSWSMVVPLGASVVLPCINDKPLTAEELKVEWKKSDSESPVFVYQDERSESYSGRADFSTDDIKHGIFSLLLKNVTAQDEGEYTCDVYRGKCNVLSVTTTLELRLLGKSQINME
ncbi:Butyrophilin-like protein 9 [Triplophysa tibetana]|uniref:Butyrophilin-like protein 9 n=1 Tax=Triplophysa tibetana TaxID=1572043 RepID=A0A5A9NA65_9TELE|nr:Butyrophilin-like protein 9 [Triplophysa tibetana]